MTLVVAIEHHFVESGDRVYTSLAFGYEYWKEYLEVFDEVYVLARVGYSDVVPKDHFIADGPGVKFIYVPDYLGIWQFLRHMPGLFAAAFRSARLGTCFILRSGNICTALWLCLKLLGKPYSREVQGHIDGTQLGDSEVAFNTLVAVDVEQCDPLAFLYPHGSQGIE